MSLLTELEELDRRLFSINIALLAELAAVLCCVSFGAIGTALPSVSLRERNWAVKELSFLL